MKILATKCSSTGSLFVSFSETNLALLQQFRVNAAIPRMGRGLRFDLIRLREL